MKRKLINSCSNTLLVAVQEVTSLGSDVASGALLHNFLLCMVALSDFEYF